jgi:hypothetical protein
VTATLDAPDVVMGKAEPRLWTRPLRALAPGTSLGFEVIAFAEQVLDVELLPWQRWWLIHALELKQNGRDFRFRTVLTLVGRQNGKTFLIKVLALWMLYVQGRRYAHKTLVLGVAQSLDIAKEAWSGAVDLAQDVPDLAAEIPARSGVRYANGEITLSLVDGSRYRISAATRAAGRGLSVDLLVLDELREHQTWDAWAALSKTTTARPNGLTMAITNQGDDKSIVLNQLRASALAGEVSTLGIFEYSAPDGCRLDDLDALAQSNPGLGTTVTMDALMTSRATDAEAVYRTEVLCQRVAALQAAIDPDAWAYCANRDLDLAPYRDMLCWCVDVSYDDRHVALAVACQLSDGRVAGQVVDAWDSTAAARGPLVAALRKHKPRALGWFQSGPGAALGAEITTQHAENGGPVGQMNVAKTEMLDYAPGVIALHGGDAVEACQSLAALVIDNLFEHPDDPLLNAHVQASERKDQGDGWRFARKGSGRNNAAYALAGAVLLARRLPATKPIPRSVIF